MRAGAQLNPMGVPFEETPPDLREVLAAYAKVLDPADPQTASALAAIEEFNASSPHPVRGDGDANVILLIVAAIHHIKSIHLSRHQSESVALLRERGIFPGSDVKRRAVAVTER